MNDKEPVVRYDGALDDFFGDAFRRGALVAFASLPKSGKSFWLMDVVYRAVKQGRRVAWFYLEDRESVARNRYMRREQERPLEPVTYRYPVDLVVSSEGIGIDVEVRRENDYSDADFDMLEAVDSGMLLLHHAGFGQLSVKSVQDRVQAAAVAGEPFDVIVVDCDNCLQNPKGVEGHDEQLNVLWLRLGKLAAENDCLVVTGTHVGGWNGVEDSLFQKKPYYAHASAVVGIDAGSTEDRYRGLQRLYYVTRRDGELGGGVAVAGCFAVSNPAVLAMPLAK